jgi:hypothetical protein
MPTNIGLSSDTFNQRLRIAQGGRASRVIDALQRITHISWSYAPAYLKDA